MQSSDKLRNVADEFLTNTDLLYEDCVSGLKNLDRIVIDVTHTLSDMTRGFLVPIVYAYWERFYKTSFSEYIRCLEKAEIDLSEVNPNIVAMRFRKELVRMAKEHKIAELHLIADKFEIDGLRHSVGTFSSLLYQPLSFPHEIDWVDTESNVSYKVLESMCKKWNVDIQGIKLELETKEINIFPKLKELVDARNSIAHGDEFKNISQDEWNLLKIFIKELMSALQFTLFAHLEQNHTVLK